MLRRIFLATVSLLATVSPLSAQTPPGEPSPAAAPSAVEPSNKPDVESPNKPEPMEDPQLGDHWTYEIRDEITGDVKSTITTTVTDVSATEISIRLAALGKPDVLFQTFDRSWNATTNGAWRFTPNDGSGIRVPLEVGKTWPIKSTDLNSTAGVSLKRSGISKVTAKESITTRAGTFDTFKIESSIRTQNANDPTKKYQAEQQTWYAPAIDHWVKRSFVTRLDGKVRERSTVELVEYGRR